MLIVKLTRTGNEAMTEYTQLFDVDILEKHLIREIHISRENMCLGSENKNISARTAYSYKNEIHYKGILNDLCLNEPTYQPISNANLELADNSCFDISEPCTYENLTSVYNINNHKDKNFTNSYITIINNYFSRTIIEPSPISLHSGLIDNNFTLNILDLPLNGIEAELRCDLVTLDTQNLKSSIIEQNITAENYYDSNSANTEVYFYKDFVREIDPFGYLPKIVSFEESTRNLFASDISKSQLSIDTFPFEFECTLYSSSNCFIEYTHHPSVLIRSQEVQKKAKNIFMTNQIKAPCKSTLSKFDKYMEFKNSEKELHLTIDLNEEECAGKSIATLKHQNYRDLFDKNISNLQKTYEKTKDALFGCIINIQTSNITIKKLQNIMKSSIFSYNKDDIAIDTKLIEPTILYLIQVMNAKTYYYKLKISKNQRDAIKSLFYPMYPFYKIISFQQSNTTFSAFYYDFMELYEVFRMFGKLINLYDYDKCNVLLSDLLKAYEIQKEKYIFSNIEKKQIERFELALSKIFDSEDLANSVYTIQELFNKNYREIYLEMSNANNARFFISKAHSMRKPILYLLYLISYKISDAEKSKEIFFMTNSVSQDFYRRSLNWSPTMLLALCSEYIKMYVICLIKGYIFHYVKMIQKNTKHILSKYIIRMEHMKDETNPHNNNKSKSALYALSRTKQMCKLKVYNLCMLKMIYFVKVYSTTGVTDFKDFFRNEASN